MTREEDLPEVLQSLIRAWQDGDISEDVFPALERVLSESPFDPGSPMGAGKMGACGTKEALGEYPGAGYVKRKVHGQAVGMSPAPDHHSLHEQREELHSIYLGLQVHVDNAQEILGILDGFVTGIYEGRKENCDKQVSFADNMPLIIRALRTQEEVLASTLAGIRVALDGGPYPAED